MPGSVDDRPRTVGQGIKDLPRDSKVDHDAADLGLHHGPERAPGAQEECKCRKVRPELCTTVGDPLSLDALAGPRAWADVITELDAVTCLPPTSMLAVEAFRRNSLVVGDFVRISSSGGGSPTWPTTLRAWARLRRP
jgi:hypothetical protein